MVDFNLEGLEPAEFEQLTQALCIHALGARTCAFGPRGPDGGREATVTGLLTWDGGRGEAEVWDGYTVVQAKHRETQGEVSANSRWLRGEIRKELARWTEDRYARSRTRRPDNLLIVTNVRLSAVTGGGIDSVNQEISQLVGARCPGLRWRLWHYDDLRAQLIAHGEVRTAFPALLTPGDVLAALARQDSPPAAFATPALLRLAGRNRLSLPGLRRRHRRRDPTDLALHLANGAFPLVREVNPILLGVKAAIGTYQADGTICALPPYVSRDADSCLAEAVAAGGLIVVHGPPAAGKTRTAVEVLRRWYPDHRMVVPQDGQALQDLAVTDLGKNVVIWLDDLERYLGAGGPDFTTLVQCLHPAPVLATMGDGELRQVDDGRQLPPRHEVAVKPLLSHAECKGLSREALADGRIRQALRAEEGFGEYLAAGQALLRQWTLGEGALFQVGQALISAAVDCRRVGYDEPVPAASLDRLYRHYLPPAWRERSDLPPTAEGLRWASEIQLGASSCLRPLPGETYRASDYLVDVAQRGEGPAGERPALAVWTGVLDMIPPVDAVVIGFHALAYGELDIAETAFRIGTDAGDTDAITGRGMLAMLRGEDDAAEDWFARAAGLGHPDAMANLGLFAMQRGDRESAERWYRQAAAAGRLESMEELALLLADRGADIEAREWLERIVDTGGVAAMHNLGVRFAERGDLQQAETWLRRALDDAGLPETMYCLGLCSMPGDAGQAAEWFRRAAELGHVEAMYNHAVLFRERGDLKLAEEGFRQAADAGLPDAMYGLGCLLYERGDQDQAETWRMRAAKAGDRTAAYQIGVTSLAKGDRAEAANWLLHAARSGNPDAMHELGQMEHERGETAGAEAWFLRAALAGHVQAMCLVGGLMYLKGDTGQAQLWLGEAAEHGDANAAFALGLIFQARDPALAAPWYRRASELGHAKAAIHLGAVLAIDGNEEEARPWLHAAAQQGHARSMANYGILRWRDGDLADAELWLRRAAEQGEVDAMTRLGLILNEQERAEEAEPWWRQAAGAGDSLGQYLLACHLRQTGRPDEGEPLLREAAEAGFSFAMADLARLLNERGQADEAAAWTRRANEIEAHQGSQ